MEKNNLKETKGITLIALVITIIVMLILVAVTINMAVNGGLFEYAGDAARRTEEEKQAERELANLKENMSTDELIAKYTGEDFELSILKKYFVGNDVEDLLDENQHYKNNDIITDAATSIQNIENNYINNSREKVIQYKNKYYKYITSMDFNIESSSSGSASPSINPGVLIPAQPGGTSISPVEVEKNKFIDVIKLTDEELMIIQVSNNGVYLGNNNHDEYYKYEDKRYKIFINGEQEKFQIEIYNVELKDIDLYPDSIQIDDRSDGYLLDGMFEYEDISITSNNSNIVTVEGYYIKGMTEGDTTITLTGLKSGKSKNVTVHVNEATK